MALASGDSKLEELLYRKIILYNDLRDCLKREQASLINIELDQLWDISREKEEICAGITALKQEILNLTNPGDDPLSTKADPSFIRRDETTREKVGRLNQTLSRLKGEVEALRKENISFVDHSLHFIDEMISVITGENRSGGSYNKSCRLRPSGNPILLSREA